MIHRHHSAGREVVHQLVVAVVARRRGRDDAAVLCFVRWRDATTPALIPVLRDYPVRRR